MAVPEFLPSSKCLHKTKRRHMTLEQDIHTTHKQDIHTTHKQDIHTTQTSSDSAPMSDQRLPGGKRHGVHNGLGVTGIVVPYRSVRYVGN